MMVLDSKDFPPLPFSKTKEASPRLRIKVGNGKSSISRSPAAMIDELPDELLLNILDFLPGIDMGHYQLPSLVSLSLASRHLHRMVAERLFLSYNSHFCDPYLFLRTVSSRPHLAELVKHADILYGTYAHRDRKRYVASAQDKKIVKEGLRKLGFPDWKTWAVDCNDKDIDIETLHTAVLMHTPNIVSLKIRETERPGPRNPHWLELIRKVVTGTSLGHMHQFENLRSIHVDAMHFYLSELSPLWRLQTLRQLSLRNLVAVESGDGQNASTLQRLIPISCNNIEELVLELSFLSMNILRILVASSKRLKTLQLDVLIDIVPEDIDPYSLLSSMAFCDVLNVQKEFLENLHVRCDAFVEDELRSAIDLYEGLRGFTVLKHLNCPLGLIARPDSPIAIMDCLPSSIITLHWTIEDSTANGHYLDSLEHMAASLGPKLSPLEEIRLVIPASKSWNAYKWDRLTEIFSESGISFILEQKQDDDDGFSDNWAAESTDSSNSSDEVSLYSNED